MGDAPVNGLVALSTDFGSDSTYVAQMKGVLLSADPSLRIVDVSHSLPAHNIAAAELHLRGVGFAFPLGCVHVVVVDPGVGSNRRAIAVQLKGMRFVGPDNGVLGRFASASGAAVVELDRPQFFRQPVAPTFHGRDIFSPVAAELALGLEITQVGTRLSDPVASHLPEPTEAAGWLRGEVLGLDRFGNATTNIPVRSSPARVRLPELGLELRWVRSYWEASRDERVALVGSDGFLEVARRERSSQLPIGTPVELESSH